MGGLHSGYGPYGQVTGGLWATYEWVMGSLPQDHGQVIGGSWTLWAGYG